MKGRNQKLAARSAYRYYVVVLVLVLRIPTQYTIHNTQSKSTYVAYSTAALSVDGALLVQKILRIFYYADAATHMRRARLLYLDNSDRVPLSTMNLQS
jgi:hypothetical protein